MSDNPIEEIPEKVDAPAEDVPIPVTPEPEEHHESHDDKVLGAIDALGNKIIDALNTLKETSPVTPQEEELLDETPIRKPWTHRGFGRG